MIVEIVGLPGAGKSTVKKQCRTFAKKQGLREASSDKLLRLDEKNRKIAGYIMRNPMARILHRHEKYQLEHGEAMNAIRDLHQGNMNALSLFMNTLHLQNIYREHKSSYDAYFIDEGLLHRAVYIALKREQTDHSLLINLLEKLPKPDLVIYLNIPSERAQQRVIERLAERSGESIQSPNVLKRIHNAHGSLKSFEDRKNMIETAIMTIDAQNVKIVEISSDQGLKSMQEDLELALQENWSTH